MKLNDMRVAIDIEADNLFPYITKIWCVSLVNIDTGSARTFTDPDSFRNANGRFETIVGHNILGYDLFALQRCWGIEFTVGPDEFCGYPVEIVDTLAWSRYLWPDRPWGHSLGDWGTHLGMPKIEHKDFTQYSEAMKTYCEQDAAICAAVYKELLKEKANAT